MKNINIVVLKLVLVAISFAHTGASGCFAKPDIQPVQKRDEFKDADIISVKLEGTSLGRVGAVYHEAFYEIGSPNFIFTALFKSDDADRGPINCAKLELAIDGKSLTPNEVIPSRDTRTSETTEGRVLLYVDEGWTAVIAKDELERLKNAQSVKLRACDMTWQLTQRSVVGMNNFSARVLESPQPDPQAQTSQP